MVVVGVVAVVAALGHEVSVGDAPLNSLVISFDGAHEDRGPVVTLAAAR